MSYFPEPSLRAPEKQKRKTKWTPNGLIHNHSLSSSIFCFVMATLTPAGLPPWSSAKRTNFSCCTERVELALFFSFGISPWDPLPWIM